MRRVRDYFLKGLTIRYGGEPLHASSVFLPAFPEPLCGTGMWFVPHFCSTCAIRTAVESCDTIPKEVCVIDSLPGILTHFH